MDFEMLKELLAEATELEPDEITPEANLEDDLGLDSLDLLDISMAIEDECGKGIPEEQLYRIKTIGDILAILEE